MKDWRLFTRDSRIAYFSMEIGLSSDIPTYSGGLGVLAGDTIKSTADLKIPMVAVTLLHRKGFFRQELTAEGIQREHPVSWNPESFMERLPIKTLVTIEDRDVKIQAWLYRVKSPAGGVVPVLFLDTDIPGNLESDRRLTDHLYGGDLEYRLKQEIILGIGGARILSTLGFDIRKYHMNEGHASFLTLELLSHNRNPEAKQLDDPNAWDLKSVSKRCVFTTHTPVEAGHDRFPYEMIEKIGPSLVPIEIIKKLGGDDMLNMTMLALNLSHYVNGVAKKHGEVSQALFPGFEIHAITNGVHPFTWTSPYMVSLFDRYIPGWAHEPELLVRVDNIPDEELWDAHCGAKALLFQYIEETTGQRFDPDILTVGFARRSATYKRGDMIFTDLERLLKIGEGKLQFIFAGKSHPKDEPGKEIIQRIHERVIELGGRIKVIYLQNYDMELAYKLIPGVDIWLNNPMRPREASGTSGMKAAFNGVPNFSVLDGWWIEGHIENVTGWSIGPAPTESTMVEISCEEDVRDLYEKLEDVIIPTYYEDRKKWISIMKGAIGKNAYYFNTHVMMRRYVTESYMR